jgi:hypothetical protein
MLTEQQSHTHQAERRSDQLRGAMADAAASLAALPWQPCWS